MVRVSPRLIAHGEVFMSSRRCFFLFHAWECVEAIGDVWTYRCKRPGCPARRTRVR